MRIQYTINGDVLVEDVLEMDTPSELTLEERCTNREKIIRIYLDYYKNKYDWISNNKGECEVYLIFESKMNSEDYE